MTAHEFLARLESVRTVKDGWMARCPAHDDRNPSLSISEVNGKILLKCQAGCETRAVVAALGLSMSDLFAEPKPNGNGAGRRIVATYDYTDEAGKLLFQVVRYDPKDFRQRRPDGKGGWIWNLERASRVLYNLPAVLKAKAVLVLEGEKDVEAARGLELVATCNPHGAGKWRPEYSESLRGKRVAVICDADAPGRFHVAQVAGSLFGKVEALKVLELPGSKDLSEWVECGGTRETLVDLIKSAPEWKPARDGDDILNAVSTFVARFLALNEAQARAVALWVAHTHAFDAADCTPYLSVNSAEKQSGKTRLLECARLLVASPWFTGRATAAVLVRKIDATKPTLLLDESDAAFSGEKEYAEALRGTLNNGYKRGGCHSLCVGKGSEITFKDFSVFCAKAIAGIGKLPDTVADRSIPIRLKRAQRGAVERFRERDAEKEAAQITAKLAAWCAGNVETLEQARPEIPPQLSDRQTDVCEPLLAIADLAGGDWPRAARQAVVDLCTKAQTDDDSIGTKLLFDVRRIFTEKQAEEIPSADLCDSLAHIETSPWGEWSKGKPLSPAKLARLLKPFEVYPCQIENWQARGYRLSQFQDSFVRYLPPISPIQSVGVSETRINSGDDEGFKVSDETASDTFKNAVSVNNNAPSRHFDTLKPRIEEMDREPGASTDAMEV